MRCSDAREALSAWMDGEVATAQPLQVSRHLGECEECRAFADGLPALSELTGVLMREPAAFLGTGPDSGQPWVPVVRSSQRPRRSSRVRMLCVGLVVLCLAELVAAFSELVTEHGYGGEDHAGHESLSFTLAVCAGLLWIAWRPAYARSYLPLVGVAAALLGATAAVDVVAGRAELVDELPHLGFMAGFVLLWLLSHGSDTGTAMPALPSPGHEPPRPRLRMVRGALRASALAVVPIAVMVAAPSSGHAVLEASTPGEDAVVQHLPASVTLRFDEPVTTLPTSVEVYGPDGKRVDDGAVTHPDGNGAEVAVGTTGAQRGTYLVSWRVVSADSHPVSGAFTFSVGARSTAPKAPISHGDAMVGGLLGGARWLGYAGIAVALGGTVFLLACWPSGWTEPGPRRLLGAGMLAIAAGAVASLLLKGPYDAALGLPAMTRGSLVREVLGTTYGKAQVARLALTAAGALLFVGGGRPRPFRTWVMAAVGAGLVATYAAAGHAVTGHPRWLALPADLIHVAAMCVWLGGLVMLVAFVLRRRSEPEAAGRAVRRFSAFALTAVSLLAVTGGYQAWRQVRSWGALTSTTYGRELIVKVALVAAVLVVAAASRRWVRAHRSDLAVLRRRAFAETLGITVILGLTSALVATDPARSAYHPSVSADLQLGPDVVQVSAVPAGDRRMQVHLYVFDRRDRPTEPRQVSASLALASQAIGPLPVSLRKVGRGHRIADVAVPVAGDWTMSVDVRTTAIDEYTKSLTLPIR